MSRIIINTDKKKFFLKVDEVEDKDFNGCDSKCIDKIIKITITDGRTVWESTKVHWNDLIKLKPDGIEDSIQSSAIKLALYGNGSDYNSSELKEEDLVVEFKETVGGNLNFGWKLKQSYGITILLGAIMLLKQSEDDSQSKLMDLLKATSRLSDLETKLKESVEFNKKLMEEYEMIVKGKLEEEEELYTKFRELLKRMTE